MLFCMCVKLRLSHCGATQAHGSRDYSVKADIRA